MTRAPHITGDISFTLDARSGMFHVVGHGMWTVEQAWAHFARMETAARTWRARGTPVLVLVDLRKAYVQTRETAQAMLDGTRRIHGGRDHVAIVTASMLHVMQVKATTDVGDLATFNDLEQAKAWLARYRAAA